MLMRFPLLAQELECALGERHVTIGVALAAPDVKEHALGVDVAHLEIETFTQAQSAGIDRGQTDAMIQRRDLGEDHAHFASGKHDGQFELGIGADQFQFGRPDAVERFFPEEFKGTDGLRGSLTGDLLVRLEMDAVLADLLGGEQIGGLGVELAELANTSVVSLFGARADGQQFEIIGERF